jgi:hypothetical protein
MHKILAIIRALINGDASIESAGIRHISVATVRGIEAAHN